MTDPGPAYDPDDIADILGWPCAPEPIERDVTILPDISTWQETT